MAIYGIGQDLVRLERFRRALERWGERFQQRVFTEAEIAVCNARRNPASCFAVRFAAKEAFLKALGIGLGGPLGWHDLEIRSTERGKPVIMLSPKALDYC